MIESDMLSTDGFRSLANLVDDRACAAIVKALPVIESAWFNGVVD